MDSQMNAVPKKKPLTVQPIHNKCSVFYNENEWGINKIQRKVQANNVAFNRFQPKEVYENWHCLPKNKQYLHPAHVASYYTGEVLHEGFPTNVKYQTPFSYERKVQANNVPFNQFQPKEDYENWHRLPQNTQYPHPSHKRSYHTGGVPHEQFSTNEKYLTPFSYERKEPVNNVAFNGFQSKQGYENWHCLPHNTQNHPSYLLPYHSGEVVHESFTTNEKYQTIFRYDNAGAKNNFHWNVSIQGGIALREEQLYSLLKDSTLSTKQLFDNGFPNLNEANNNVRIFKPYFSSPLVVYSVENKYNSSTALNHSSNSYGCSGNNGSQELKKGNSSERICVRCNKQFLTTDHEYVTKEPCCYHWGKLQQCRFTCCENSPGSIGCTTGKLHVWDGIVTGINEPLEGFLETKTSEESNNHNIYALDCEMCYTLKGLELCKVTIVSYNGSIVYDHFVKTEYEVVDYNTRFSGVTEKDVNSSTSKTFSEVQGDILKLFTRDTILIGHGLNNDLRALKILHSRIVDTSLIFPHERGYPFRYSLKHLMWTKLQKNIQTSDSGHSAYEDALSCLELIYFEIRRKLKF